MPESLEQFQPHYTYGEYVQWTGDERWELIDGEPYLMSPAPTPRHQLIAGRIYGQLFQQLDDHPCTPMFAPLDVRFPDGDEADEDVRTVVQPDLIVLCDQSKIDRSGIRGAPDFIVEILSPSTAIRDEIQKAALYEKHKVREYWIVDPTRQHVIVHILGSSGKWKTQHIHSAKGTLKITALPGVSIDLDSVFKV